MNKKMRNLLVFLTFFILHIFLFVPTLHAEQDRKVEVPREYTIRLSGSLETNIGLQYQAHQRDYFFYFPLHSTIGMSLQTQVLKSYVSVRYDSEISDQVQTEQGTSENSGLAPGEMYIRGGSEYSYMKAGLYTEDWGAGHSLRPVSRLNIPHSGYPSNIFYARCRRAAPMYTITMGTADIYQQVVFSGKHQVLQSINNTTAGLRTVWSQWGMDFTAGMIRKIGCPPPLFFITSMALREGAGAWVEAGWEYNKGSRDRWSLVIGGRRQLDYGQVYVEYIYSGFHSFLYMEEILEVDPSVEFSLKSFLHIGSWSFAGNGFFSISVAPGFQFEPGFFLFLGGPGDYFSGLREDHHNEVYVRFKLDF
ncbi:MAG: hypothetical protein ACOC7U_06140 [Spirochaetota bacterium]